ncbi:hypothetical protein ACFX2G_033640 [Malus domestica]|nr:uncharacterized protein LOC114824414 [Malus domestica]
MLRRSSRAISLSLSDKLMLRRSLFGPRFKAKSLSISGQRKNPDRPPKLRDVKKQVKAVQESQSPIQLEKEEAHAVKPCEVCGGAAGSHPSVVCPYLHDVPWHVTSVGEGYKIACWFCWKGQYCRHLKRYVIRLRCMKCGANGLHTFWDCPERRGKGIEMPSVRRVKLIGTSSVRPGMSQLRRPRW